MSLFGRFFHRTEELKLSEARKLFERFRETRQKELQQEKQRILGEFKHLTADTQEALAKLREAKLINERIFPRERSIMEGNRKAYINQVERLLQGLASEELYELAEGYRKSIDSFLKSTFKSYQVLTQFFETEVSMVAKNLRRLDRLVSASFELRKREQGIKRVEALFNELSGASDSRKHQRELARQKRLEHSSVLKQLSGVERKLKELRGSAELKRRREAEARIEQYKRQRQSLLNKLHGSLARFSKLFRKYHNLMGDKLSLQLSEEPVLAFRKQPDGVIKILTQLPELILRNQIRVKESDRVKLIERLKGLSTNKLRACMAEADTIKQAIAEQKQLINRDTSQQHILELEHAKESLQKRADALKQELQGLKQPKTNSAVLKQKLAAKLSKLTNKEIKII